jgi:predicted Ser/Thr protein kinase
MGRMAGAIASGGLLKDRYRLERMLGRGGMAAVWLAHDETLERPVAVKVLSDTIASDPGFLARFRREARTAARLSHPNLARVYDFSDEGERPYLVMEMVPGENLASRLEAGERIDRDQLARELLEALSHIHEVGILHRDIKPANIIVEPDGTAKLIDFGIALTRDATALTNPGLVLGTGRYVAPEVMGGRTATERSDLYSCGLVLQSCDGPCSPQLARLVEAMTSRDPRGRPLSAEEALDELEPPRAGEQTTEAWHPPTAVHTQRLPLTRDDPPPPPPPPPPPELSKQESGGSRRRVAATILGLLAAAAIVAFVVLGGGDSPAGAGRRMAQAKEHRGESAATQRQTTESGTAAASEEASEPDPSEELATPTEEAGGTAVAAPSEPSGSDEARGVALNEEGFAMIQAGEYETAVPILEEAVDSFPEGTEDLNYAYSLFNLGHALRLSGRPEEAIPVLERRQEIPDQEDAVREELEAAQAEAG